MLLGAVAAPILMVLAMSVVHRPQPGTWDMGVGMMMLLAGACLVPIGAVGGYFVAGALQTGDGSAARRFAIIVVFLAAAPALFVAAVPYLPEIAPRRANARARAKWARERSAPQSSNGESLASSLEKCLQRARTAVSAEQFMRGDFNCERLRATWYGAGADSIAAQYGYLSGDDGWRWELGPDGRSAVVFPDPLFKMPGPIFEVRAGRVVRRDTRDSPAFATSRYLADIEKSRACIARHAAALKADGRWDGDGATLPALLALPETVLAGCPTVFLPIPHRARPGIVKLNLSGRMLQANFEVHHHVVPGGYEWRFRYGERSYLIDIDGGWHVGQNGPATADDPPPERCLLDLSLACE